MGTVYCGPYAEQVGYEHEGYAARRLPNGSLTGTWTSETWEFLGYVAACTCGWYGETCYASTDGGEDQALAEWDRAHLQSLIAIARDDRPAKAGQVAARVTQAAEHIVPRSQYGEADNGREELVERVRRLRGLRSVPDQVLIDIVRRYGCCSSPCFDSDSPPFSDEEFDTDRALVEYLCAGCPVIDHCLELELRTSGGQTVGVFGCTTEAERRELHRLWLADRESAEADEDGHGGGQQP